MTTERELELQQRVWVLCERYMRWPDTPEIGGIEAVQLAGEVRDAIAALDAHRAAASDDALVERMKWAYVGAVPVDHVSPAGAGLRAVLALLRQEGWKGP